VLEDYAVTHSDAPVTPPGSASGACRARAEHGSREHRLCVQDDRRERAALLLQGEVHGQIRRATPAGQLRAARVLRSACHAHRGRSGHPTRAGLASVAPRAARNASAARADGNARGFGRRAPAAFARASAAGSASLPRKLHAAELNAALGGERPATCTGAGAGAHRIGCGVPRRSATPLPQGFARPRSSVRWFSK